MKFDHIGIPTRNSFEGEIPLPHLRMTVSDHQDKPFGIQWQRYWEVVPLAVEVRRWPLGCQAAA
jgi:hypothetical protein